MKDVFMNKVLPVLDSFVLKAIINPVERLGNFVFSKLDSVTDEAVSMANKYRVQALVMWVVFALSLLMVWFPFEGESIFDILAFALFGVTANFVMERHSPTRLMVTWAAILLVTAGIVGLSPHVFVPWWAFVGKLLFSCLMFLVVRGAMTRIGEELEYTEKQKHAEHDNDTSA